MLEKDRIEIDRNICLVYLVNSLFHKFDKEINIKISILLYYKRILERLDSF